eukprot:GHVL01025986.1.p1 GENE.GHVL01025986.1~~GHVL01025986.1.p1  ORF type:complete len:201 (-),score=61.45 GHVL01025986.1:59-661(-)
MYCDQGMDIATLIGDESILSNQIAQDVILASERLALDMDGPYLLCASGLVDDDWLFRHDKDVWLNLLSNLESGLSKQPLIELALLASQCSKVCNDSQRSTCAKLGAALVVERAVPLVRLQETTTDVKNERPPTKRQKGKKKTDENVSEESIIGQIDYDLARCCVEAGRILIAASGVGGSIEVEVETKKKKEKKKKKKNNI